MGGMAMSDLDQKLADILQNPLYKIESSGKPNMRDGRAVHDVAGDVEAIKQAFKEAGYSKSPLTTIREQMQISGMMTGPEWYDKLEKELTGMAFPYNGSDVSVINAVNRVKAAARRAAGLSDE